MNRKLTEITEAELLATKKQIKKGLTTVTGAARAMGYEVESFRRYYNLYCKEGMDAVKRRQNSPRNRNRNAPKRQRQVDKNALFRGLMRRKPPSLALSDV